VLLVLVCISLEHLRIFYVPKAVEPCLSESGQLPKTEQSKLRFCFVEGS
jgi:hypothetical protein